MPYVTVTAKFQNATIASASYVRPTAYVTRVTPSATASYQNIQAVGSINYGPRLPQTFSLVFADSFSVIDVIQIPIIRGASDTSSTSDSASIDFGKNVSDTSAYADATSFDFSKALSDVSTNADAALIAFSKALSDVLTNADAAAINFGKALSDVSTSADAVGISYNMNIADAFTSVDVFGYVTTGLNPSFSENSTSADAGSIARSDYVDETYLVAITDYVVAQSVTF